MTQNWQSFIEQFPISTPSAKMLVDLSQYGVIQVSGPDAAKFLQGQLTCDVNSLVPGAHSLLGSYCNIKGKVDSIFRIWRQGEDYFLRLLLGMVEPTLEELKKYSVFSKVEIQNVTGKICGFGVYNNGVNFSMLDPKISVLEIEPLQRYEIYGPIKELESAWHTCNKQATHVDPAVWNVLDIQAQIPELYPQTVGLFFPHDLNLHSLGAVSFTKGCFRGQEIIARMQHRGKLKRAMQTISSVEHRFMPGDQITAGGPEQETVAGTVVRSCRSNDGKSLGLAVITDTCLDLPLAVHNKRIVVTQ